jgi:hypothetical protein
MIQKRPASPESNSGPARRWRATVAGWPNGVYCVLTSADVALPQSNRTRLMTNTFDGSGNFIFANPAAPNAGGRFYRLQLP